MIDIHHSNYLTDAVDELEELSKIFVDTNILNRLSTNKDQIIYGRRGTGKTHILGRIQDHYKDSLYKTKVIPIYIDGSLIAQRSSVFEGNPGLSILIGYRFFIESIIQELEDFIEDNVALSMLERLYPGGRKGEKLNNLKNLLRSLKEAIRKEEVEVGPGL